MGAVDGSFSPVTFLWHCDVLLPTSSYNELTNTSARPCLAFCSLQVEMETMNTAATTINRLSTELEVRVGWKGVAHQKVVLSYLKRGSQLG